MTDDEPEQDHVLVLTRKAGESFVLVLGECRVIVSVVAVYPHHATRIAITAPGDVRIVRSELRKGQAS